MTNQQSEDSEARGLPGSLDDYQTLLEQYHSDLFTIFITSILSVLLFVLLVKWVGGRGIVQESMMSLFASIISAVMITTFYYIRNIPVIV